MTDKEIIEKIGEEIGINYKSVSRLRWMRLNNREYEVVFEGEKVKGIASRNLKPHHFILLSTLTELEFLDVSWSRKAIKELPQSIYNLVNLKGLWCGHTKLQMLPQGMDKLTNLEALDLHDTPWRELPPWTDKLARFEHLTHPIWKNHPGVRWIRR